MSSPTIMKRVGDAAKGYMGKLKSLPPDSGEQASIKDKAEQVTALKNTTVPTEPERTGSEPMPMPAYGSRPGEKRLEYALKPAPISIPTYDQGGDVKVQPVEKETMAAPGQKKSPLAMKPVIHETMNVDTGKPSSSLPPLTPDIKPMSMPHVYDDGGDVDVNDGKHQVAILKEGEKVLTPEQAAAYRAGQQQGAPADFAGRVIPNPTGIKIKDVDSVQPRADEPTSGAKMSTDNAPLTPPKGDTSNAPLDEAQPTNASTGSQKARPYADVAAEQKKAAEEKVANPGAQTGGAQEPTEAKIEPRLPTATDAERLAIKTDQQQAMGQGVNGLTKLGMANIHAKQLGLDSEDLSHVEDKLNPTTGDEGIKQPGYMPGGAPPAGIPKMGDVTLPGSTPPPQPTMGQEALQGTSDMGDQAKASMPKLGQQNFKEQLSQLKKEHSAALGERSAQGKVKADYIQAQINDLQRNNPYGSAENHPGFLGKLGHIAAGVGNVAGDVLAPKTMALIPGTQLNKGLAANKLQAETAEDQKNATAQAAAEAKPGAQDTYKEATQGGLVDPAHPELGPQQAYVDEHDPSKVHFAGPMPPKPGEVKDQPANADQQKDYQQRIANSGLTGQALQTYGTIPKGATTAELDKRFDEATKLRGMDQKDQETTIQNQARKDAADEKQFEHEQARADKLENQHFSYVDDKGKTQITTGDKLADLPEGTQTIPIKDVSNLVGEARSMNAVQENLNVLHKDIEEHPEVFNNAAARGIIQTTTEQMNRASVGMLVAGTGGQIPLPSGMGDMINTQLQNHAMDDKTAKAVKNYIADYKALKDKAMVIQMMMQNGKMGRGGMQAFDSIVNQLPGGSTPDSPTALRQMDALQKTTTGLMGKYPEKYADYTKAKPYEAKPLTPKQGDVQQHAGANYQFDGTQWVKQK